MISLQIHDFLGIGDAIQFSHIPENIYHFTGEYCININNHWSLKYNPYIQTNYNTNNITSTIDLWNFSKHMGYGYKSHADRFFTSFNNQFRTNFVNPVLRHPRLYYLENNKIIRNRVIVHTTGKSEIVPMSDDAIKQIAKNYSDCEIIQIGGLQDKPTPFINKLGLSIWKTLDIISSSAIFIGINSGMMNLANCYPKLQKKIFIPRDLDAFSPLTKYNVWFDFNTEYFNYHTYDYGTTMSYLKI
jgi:hypothetical protein